MSDQVNALRLRMAQSVGIQSKTPTGIKRKIERKTTTMYNSRKRWDDKGSSNANSQNNCDKNSGVRNSAIRKSEIMKNSNEFELTPMA